MRRAWLRYKGLLINLDNVTHVERLKGKNVVFHFKETQQPLFIPFENDKTAENWFRAILLLFKSSGSTVIDASNLNLKNLN